MLDFGLVREALQERGLLLTRLAPHLVRPVPFLYPLTSHWERPYVGAGLALYDAMAMAGGRPVGVPTHRHLSRRKALRVAPDLRPDSLTGAVQYYDCQVDDARHTMMLARTAAHHGATVATRTRVTGFVREGERVTGVTAHDLETGDDLVVRAQHGRQRRRRVDRRDPGDGRRPRRPQRAGAARASTSSCRATGSGPSPGIILRTETSVLFVIPWGRHWIIGTTDTAWNLDKAHPAASRADIDYLLDHVNGCCASRSATTTSRACTPGCGRCSPGSRRPRAASRASTSSCTPVPGLVLVAGGKYTTYRVMAADAVDAAATPSAGRSRRASPTGCRCSGRGGLRGAHATRRTRSRARSGLHRVRIEHLLGRYGDLVDELLELVAADPALGEPLPGAEDYLAAEVVYAVTHEGARHLDDVLTRRTRISIETFDRGVAAAPAGRGADGRPARLGRGGGRQGGRPLPAAGGGRAAQPAAADDQEADEARVQSRDVLGG